MDVDIRIVPCDPFVVFGTVVACYPVAYHRIWLKRTKGMSEANGDPELIILLRCQNY